MKRDSRRPSPALVISILALVVAMAGTAFAATKLPKNSVGSKQIKKNAITTAKVKKQAITSAKIKLSTLKTVPSAEVANSVPPREATHLIGAPGEPGFEGGAFNVPGGMGVTFQPAGFFKDRDDVVHLQGFVVTGAGPLGAAFTLPPGFRPPSTALLFFEAFPGPHTLLVGGTGTNIGGNDVTGKVFSAPEEGVSLEGITFRAGS